MELEALHQLLPDFERAGARVFGACPQRPEFSRAMETRSGLGFPVLQDVDNRAATAFGLTVPTPPDVRQAEAYLGLDLPRHNGTDHWDLPMPARYVIGRDGTVLYASIHADHTRRRDPEEALAALMRPQ